MKKRWLGTIAALAVAALAVGVVPAFTADNGTVTVTVSVQAPAAPCLTVTPGSVDFGTLPFSASNAAVDRSQASSNITFNNCGTAGQNLLGSTTNATGPGGSWTPLAYTGAVLPCGLSGTDPNQFYLDIFGFTGSPSLFMTGTPAPMLTSAGGPPEVFPAGDPRLIRMTIIMPCQGSNGAGETKTLTATFTAVVA